MLFAVTGLHGRPVEAGDGHIGAVKDLPVRRPELEGPLDGG